MFVQEIALVSDTTRVKSRELMRVCAALQKQIARDFEPIWKVPATVDSFERLEDVPIGYWPIIIRDDIGHPGAAGIHLDQDGQPFSLVQFDARWALNASHEVLEMLADPFGSRVIAGDSIKSGQGRVEYLVEVCDPSEAAEFGYTVNGVLVSDFYTPAYFDPVASSGVRYSFTGHITKPRQVLRGGYLSWHNPVNDHWYQASFSGSKLEFDDLGKFDDSKSSWSLREWIDLQSFRGRMAAQKRPGKGRQATVRASSKAETYRPATAARARRWQARIRRLSRNARIGARA